MIEVYHEFDVIVCVRELEVKSRVNLFCKL